MATSLSKFIIFLLAIRPILHHFFGVKLFNFLGQEISLTAFWGIVYLVLCGVRLFFGPKLENNLNKKVFYFTVPYLIISGIVFFPGFGYFVVDILFGYTVLFTILVAPKIASDLGIRYCERTIYYGCAFAMLIHLIPMASGDGFVGFRYFGFFESKHQVAQTMVVTFPWIFIYYYKNKDLKSLTILILNIVFAVLAFQRSFLFCYILVFIYFIFKKNDLKTIIINLSLGFILFYLFQSQINNFIEQKFLSEYIRYTETGDLSSIGAGRGGILAISIYEYMNNFSLIDMIFGKGSTFSWTIHYEVVGHFAYSHIQFVNILLDMGLLGVITFYGLILKGYKYLKTSKVYFTDSFEFEFRYIMYIVFIIYSFAVILLQNGAGMSLFTFFMIYCINLKNQTDVVEKEK